MRMLPQPSMCSSRFAAAATVPVGPSRGVCSSQRTATCSSSAWAAWLASAPAPRRRSSCAGRDSGRSAGRCFGAFGGRPYGAETILRSQGGSDAPVASGHGEVARCEAGSPHHGEKGSGQGPPSSCRNCGPTLSALLSRKSCQQTGRALAERHSPDGFA